MTAQLHLRSFVKKTIKNYLFRSIDTVQGCVLIIFKICYIFYIIMNILNNNEYIDYVIHI